MYDYLIVGAGFYGSICAHELTKAGKKVLVIDNRRHIGGNCYTENKNGVNIHEYGPHIFHTSNEEVWNWVNQFAKFNNYIYTPAANYKGEIYSLPFNMWTFNKLWGVVTPEQAKKKIEEQSSIIKGEPTNLEEQAIKLVGVDVYEKLIVCAGANTSAIPLPEIQKKVLPFQLRGTTIAMSKKLPLSVGKKVADFASSGTVGQGRKTRKGKKRTRKMSRRRR